MFKTLLIANRGEIACRIIASAKRMGIRCIAVYSSCDEDARHVAMADDAVLLGDPPPQASYLAMDKIIALCQQTGAEAVHPGYGFLSENAEFVDQVTAAGIVFVGPSAASIAAMGDKISSRQLAAKAGVPVIPGWDQPLIDTKDAMLRARAIGYPVMLKATAGGGGRGLRTVHDDAHCQEAFISCRNEASKAFGDNRVFVEKYIEEPRHIEIQVLGDQHGNLVYLWERECSIQRRHQKVIEEAPSLALDEATRQAMGEAALRLARAVKYHSAGTVEFVVGVDGKFYFLEMNTRLQVEHGVTELITGLDLVEWMLRVAAKEKLTFAQKDIARKGWAIECRINAEDPTRDFLPSTGRLTYFRAPTGDGVRVDTGVTEGGEIPVYYDSMIAKLLTHHDSREGAIARMLTALDGFVIRGVHHNLAFQSALLQQQDFVAGKLHTGFIPQHWPEGFDKTHATNLPDQDKLLFALTSAMLHGMRQARYQKISGQRLAWTEPQQCVVLLDGEPQALRLYPFRKGDKEDVALIRMHERDFLLRTRTVENAHLLQGRWQELPPRTLDNEVADAMAASIGGEPFRMQFERQGLGFALQRHGLSVLAIVLSTLAADLLRRLPSKTSTDSSKLLLSPMPGLLVKFHIAEGQHIKAGQALAVIDAMKMENVLRAEHDGVVEAVLATPGASITVGEPLLKFV